MTGNLITVVEGVKETQYIATNLINAALYSFTVTARNVFGYSEPTEYLFLRCAWIPNKPQNVQTLVVTNTAVISWDEPYNNGGTITSYTIVIK